MYSKKIIDHITSDLERIQAGGKYKTEREIEGPQGAHVRVEGKDVLMFASNNYLGLSHNADLIGAANEGLARFGFGTSSVRFLSGTQTIHRELEKRIAHFIGTEDAIVYSTNFMANLGFFATLVNESFGTTEPYKDAIYSDESNHASLIDALKLCKKENVEKRIYTNRNLKMLEQYLEEDKEKGYRHKILVTDGIFSMEGTAADLPKLVELADKYEALLFVDDAHGVGVMGEHGRGTAEAQGQLGKIDIISGTLGKALGGALGGYIGGKKELVDLLRQKSRTYLFSNALPPAVVTAGIAALDMIEGDHALVTQAKENALYFRKKLEEHNLPTLPGNHAIVPLMIGDAVRATELSKKLFEEGVYAVALSFPVVPEGKARIRFQISAAHTKEDLDVAIEKIKKLHQSL
jgi:glycine C-acetyltransferase